MGVVSAQFVGVACDEGLQIHTFGWGVCAKYLSYVSVVNAHGMFARVRLDVAVGERLGLIVCDPIERGCGGAS